MAHTAIILQHISGKIITRLIHPNNFMVIVYSFERIVTTWTQTTFEDSKLVLNRDKYFLNVFVTAHTNSHHGWPTG